MLKIVHSKTNLTEEVKSKHQPSRQMAEWTQNFLTELDDLISEHVKTPSREE